MLAPVYNAVNTLLQRLTSARATLLDNLSGFAGSSYTSARGAKLDYLDTALSSRARAVSAVSSNDQTPTRSAKLDYLDTALSGLLGSFKSIQRGTITIAAGSTSNTATISSITTSKSILMLIGVRGTNSSTSDDPGNWIGRLALTSSTVITATRGTTGDSSALTVAFQVVEFN